MPFMLMNHETDPGQSILDQVGDLSSVDVCYSQVLLGIYIRPKVTRGGIHLADVSREEDRYQGKAALVLKLGPLAFKDSDEVVFQGFKVEVGQWVVIRASDGWALSVHGQDCRIVSDTAIKMIVKQPDEIF